MPLSQNLLLAATLGGLLFYAPRAGGAAAPVPEGKAVFSCVFKQGLAKPWKVLGGKWEVRGECLKQIDPGFDDPSKAILVLGDRADLATGVVLTAKLRLDAWRDSDLARAGIGLCCDPRTGHGLNLVFHGGRLQVRPRLRDLEPGV